MIGWLTRLTRFMCLLFHQLESPRTGIGLVSLFVKNDFFRYGAREASFVHGDRKGTLHRMIEIGLLVA